MAVQDCCRKISNKENSKEKNKTDCFSLLHEFSTGSTIFKWVVCGECGGLILNKYKKRNGNIDE
jgi:predicted nucleic acid-binding Zn ribbon protein